MKRSSNPQTELIELCSVLSEHIKLLRDYATTPGNEWLARSELHQIQELVAQVEALLSEIKASDA